VNILLLSARERLIVSLIRIIAPFSIWLTLSCFAEAFAHNEDLEVEPNTDEIEVIDPDAVQTRFDEDFQEKLYQMRQWLEQRNQERQNSHPVMDSRSSYEARTPLQLQKLHRTKKTKKSDGHRVRNRHTHKKMGGSSRHRSIKPMIGKKVLPSVRASTKQSHQVKKNFKRRPPAPTLLKHRGTQQKGAVQRILRDATRQKHGRRK
jgi:hypothetical protein